VQDVADINVDFAQWYTDVVRKTDLVDYGPVKGTMIIKPYGYAIWEHIQSNLDARLKASGHVNAYFPMFFPLSYLQRESEHVEGFAPEVALVTHVGNTELSEKLVVRPTSETVICEMYSKWIKSYRDLPVLINQWANVVRWEKTTRPFLRTSEFLWQEGHTAHATQAEAEQETLDMLQEYEDFCHKILAIPVLSGKKSQQEKFAGAVDTYSIEAMMLDGKSLQAGTSHYLGTNFATAFDIKYLDKHNQHQYVYQTSWGVSTRLIGALIMAHGDNRGLALPPKVAPIQVVIIPIASHKEGVVDYCNNIYKTLKDNGIRVHLDNSDKSTGFKYNEWEMKGVPIQLALGPNDIAQGQATIKRRDDLEHKIACSIDNLVDNIVNLLQDIQSNMLSKSQAFRDSRIKIASNMTELQQILQDNCWALCSWCGNHACEKTIKDTYQASSRNMPFDQTLDSPTCVCCTQPARHKIYFAKAY
jgi:prolyl-tRNA synthetase